MSSWRYFNRFACINLDRRPDRWAEAQAELKACGAPPCERISAIDRLGAPGGCASGCSATHRMLWRVIANGAWGDRAFIFEDDFMFLTRETLLSVGYAPHRDEVRLYDSLRGVTPEERLAAALEHVPKNWDLLYLGGGYESPPLARVNEHVIRNQGMLTTHTYAITPRMAELATAHLDAGYGVGTEHDPATNIGGPDSVLSGLSKRDDVFSYTVSPRLFIQRPTSPSDLNPQPLGFPWDQVDSRHELMV